MIAPTSVAFAEKNLTTEVVLNTITAPADGTLRIVVQFDALNGAAATLQVRAVIDAAGTPRECGLKRTLTKSAAATTMISMPEIIADVEADDVVTVYGFSTNASDSSESGNLLWWDAHAANTVQLAGTAQTGRDIGASVLLSPGTGTGQLAITSGVVDANAVQVSGDADAADNLAARCTRTVTYIATTDNAKTIVEAASAGDLCILGPGTHDLGSSGIAVPAGCAVYGAGSGATSVINDGTVDVLSPAGDIDLRGMTVTCPATNAAMFAIVTTGEVVVRLDDVHFTGVGDAVRYDSQGAATLVRFMARRCQFINDGGDVLVFASNQDAAEGGGALIIDLDECVIDGGTYGIAFYNIAATNEDSILRARNTFVHGNDAVLNDGGCVMEFVGGALRGSITVDGANGAASIAVSGTAYNPSSVSTADGGVFTVNTTAADTTKIAGTAVNTGAAQLGVNVVTEANIAFGALKLSSLNAATPASVVGAVGSVTGDVGGKVLGGGSGTITGTGVRAVDASGNALATPTNITAGTITTVTNLTNAPTVGDLTATMKSSITTAASSSTPTVTLADDAIKATTFDESTAFPLKSADTGSTAVARAGADSDTLETISDEVAALSAANPTAAGIADAVLDEALSGHTTAGTLGKAFDLLTGTGNILVNHDTGGTDNLTYEVDGAGIDGATIIAYLTTDYAAGNLGHEYVRGQTVTDSAGQWSRSMMLNAGAYTLVYEHPNYQVATKTVTVS
jgi:hypothetical protein